MKKINVFKDTIDGLERHTDDRGIYCRHILQRTDSPCGLGHDQTT